MRALRSHSDAAGASGASQEVYCHAAPRQGYCSDTPVLATGNVTAAWRRQGCRAADTFQKACVEGFGVVLHVNPQLADGSFWNVPLLRWDVPFPILRGAEKLSLSLSLSAALPQRMQVVCACVRALVHT